MTVQQNKKRGYELENEVLRGLEMVNGLIPYKIPDVKTFGHLMTWKVPADFLISNGFTIFTIEVKQTKLPRIPWANFKEHQMEWVENNINAYFLINFNNRVDVNRTFLVNNIEFEQLRLEYKTSVPMSAFSVELERKTAKHHPEKKGAFVDFEGIQW